MADDYSAADNNTSDLPGLTELPEATDDPLLHLNSSRPGDKSNNNEGQQQKRNLQRKPSRGARGEKLYQGRATSQKQQQHHQEQKNSQEPRRSSSKYDASPPWAQKPKVQRGESGSNNFDTSLLLVKPRQKQQAELKRPKRLSQSNIDASPSSWASKPQQKQQTELMRPKRLSNSSIISHESAGSTDDLLEGFNDGPLALPLTDKPKQLQRRRSRSAGPTQKQRQAPPPRRPSLQRRLSQQEIRPQLTSIRPQLTRRLSHQETSSRSLLAGSMQEDTRQVTALHVPLNDEPGAHNKANRRRSTSWDSSSIPDTDKKEGKTSERGRSRKGGPSSKQYARRRSRSLDAASSGKILHDLIPVEHVPMNDKPRNRIRSVSRDSGSGRSGNFEPTDIRKDLEKRRAIIEAEGQAQTRHSMPAVHTTKKVEDSKKRYSMPATMKKDRTDPNSQEQTGESSRRRSSRRTRASAGYTRLQSSFNNSFTKTLARKRKSSSAPTAAAAVASGGATDGIDEESSSRSKKERSGCYVSYFMMTVVCFCYLLSMIAVCALGFFLHMEFFAYKDTGTTVNANVGGNKGTYDNSPGGSLGDSGVTPMLRPSTLMPSGPTSGANLQPIPTDGELGTKVSPASLPPTAMASNNPSSNPTPFFSDIPSSIPTSSSHPTSTPSMSPSSLASESPSMEPTLTPSESPSLSPTALDECPEILSKSMPFISDTSLTLYYETVIYRDHPTGGLLCASLEYSGAAGWIGLAFSTAGRNPQFGRREAIIGMPGVESSVPVSSDNGTSQALNPSGNQNNFVEGGPYFFNPGKYEIPAGGLEGYYGPSLNLLMNGYQQTLVNASATISLDSNQTVTRLSFAKYLREPGEIEINPLTGPTLILYAVAPIDASGMYVNENPEWRYINLILGGSSKRKSSLTRERQHNNYDD